MKYVNALMGLIGFLFFGSLFWGAVFILFGKFWYATPLVAIAIFLYYSTQE